MTEESQGVFISSAYGFNRQIFYSFLKFKRALNKYLLTGLQRFSLILVGVLSTTHKIFLILSKSKNKKTLVNLQNWGHSNKLREYAGYVQRFMCVWLLAWGPLTLIQRFLQRSKKSPYMMFIGHQESRNNMISKETSGV